MTTSFLKDKNIAREMGMGDYNSAYSKKAKPIKLGGINNSTSHFEEDFYSYNRRGYGRDVLLG